MATCRKPSVLAYPVEREQRRRLKNKVEGKVEGGPATSSLHEKNVIVCVLSFIFPFVLLISAGPSGHKRNV